jgi:hypothetical protein
MLEMRDKCESCGSPLPMDSDKARICSYECTFCEDCAEKILHGVCPNWGPLTKRIIKHVKPWDMIEATGISPSEGVYLLARHNPRLN